MSSPEPNIQPGLPHPFAAGLGCRCPRCGKGRLFRSLFSLSLADRCTSCDLDYSFIDSGDGPAVFAIFILGFLVLGGALIAEFKFGMPLWGHIVLWGLLTPAIAIGLLKGLKGVLAALQYRYKAEQAGPAQFVGKDP